jgi:hypothetical protein
VTAIGLNGCVFVRANDGFVCRSDRGMNILKKSVAAGLDVVVMPKGAPPGSVPYVRKNGESVVELCGAEL